jgi:hypothetical protein
MLQTSYASFVGEIDQRQVGSFLGGAAVLLFPIAWPEPFGLVMIEAMACSTPVIAFDRDSGSEVLQDKVSGFTVRDEAQPVDAVVRLPLSNRNHVRAAFERRFTSDRMAHQYMRLYKWVMIAPRRPSLQLKPLLDPMDRTETFPRRGERRGGHAPGAATEVMRKAPGAGLAPGCASCIS